MLFLCFADTPRRNFASSILENPLSQISSLNILYVLLHLPNHIYYRISILLRSCPSGSCRIFFLPSKGHLCGVALDFSNNRVAFFLYCVIINIIGSGGSLNRNLTDCTGPHASSEGVGRPKGGLGVVPTRNFTDLLVQLQICNNPQSAWLTCGSGDGRVAQ